MALKIVALGSSQKSSASRLDGLPVFRSFEGHCSCKLQPIPHDKTRVAASRKFPRMQTEFRESKCAFSKFNAVWIRDVGLRDDYSPSDLFSLLQERCESFSRKLLSGMIGISLSLAILVSPCYSREETEGYTITFPASPNQEIATVQKALVQSWGIVEQSYWDPSFNNQDWMSALEKALVQTFKVNSSNEAYEAMQSMLASLNDPYTRLVSPKEYEKFLISNEGAMQGVGLLIATESNTGRVIVLSPIEGGPADRAGVHPGDELIQIDDEDISGISGPQAADKLRGKAGTSVSLTLKRSVDEGEETELTKVELKRETISLSPVYARLLTHPDSNGGEVRTGYIRLSSFSQNAAEDMENAVARLQSEGAENFILDLRNNPGGLVRSGLEVAQLWLSGYNVLVNTIDRSGMVMPVYVQNSHALSGQPLAVLVNKSSASASEILAGALHDNGRAVLIGENTYGKGKIQSVFELDDGSALFVTVAKYLSPALHQIDSVGILPDSQCLLPTGIADSDSVPSPPSSPLIEFGLMGQLEADPCVMTAEMILPANL